MTDLRTAAQQALEAMRCAVPTGKITLTDWYKSITALRAALAEPVQEPVAIVGTQEDTWKGYGSQWLSPGPPIKTVHMLAELPIGTPLYAAPPERKPLTEGDIRDLLEAEFLGRDGKRSWDGDLQVFRLAERAHGIT